jgi:hypothetical protein
MIERDGPEIAMFGALGLVETYRRRHEGQGTANACYAFENAFIELLWIEDPAAVMSDAVARLALADRAAWRSRGTSPFGIALRPTADAGKAPALPVESWRFTPPYLPAGSPIEVAKASDDHRLLLLFAFPGSTAPALWPAARRGALQQAAGFRALVGASLSMPDLHAGGAALAALADASGIGLFVRPHTPHVLDLIVTGATGTTRTLRLPDCRFLPADGADGA